LAFREVVRLSVVFVVAPAVVAGWPLLCGAVAAAAASLGYKALTKNETVEFELDDVENWVDIPIEDSQLLADAMARESSFVIKKDDVTATFSRAADGRCMVHLSGENKSEAELSEIGRELIGRVTQQYAYNKVMGELRAQGFSVTSEEVAADQTIRIHVSKFV